MEILSILGKYIIRMATWADAPALGRVAQEIYRECYAHVWANRPALAAQLQTFDAQHFSWDLEDDKKAVVLVQAKDEIVGFLRLVLDEPCPHRDRDGGAEIDRIYLKRAAQDQGVGEFLLGAAMRLVEDRGGASAWLSCFKEIEQPNRACTSWGMRKVCSFELQEDVLPAFREMNLYCMESKPLVAATRAATICHEDSAKVEEQQAFYRSQGYQGEVSGDAKVVTARAEDKIIGIVRLEPEEGLTILRGMNVAPLFQGRGVGARMLERLAPLIVGNCYCLPHRWLEGLYARIRFVRLPDAEIPSHMEGRLAAYHARGEYPIVMRRGA